MPYPVCRSLPFPVFDLTIESTISAAHAILIQGQREPLHGHDWHITVTLSGPALDDDGLLCDFHAAEAALREVTAPFHHRNFNDIPPFDRLNPTAENIAKHLADQLANRLRPILPKGASLSALRITEAPGCAATYRPS
jgi:6-pyruvoyltetrahydropterin/6-carboxytetrahydropterin synthase